MADLGTRTSTPTVFTPQLVKRRALSSSNGPGGPAPEQKLTLLALRLAVLEKLASAIGTIAFIWATVVLLGGFVSTLGPLDFWIISILLLTEGTRVFSRSNELEWQQMNSSFTAESSRLMLKGKTVLSWIRSLFLEPSVAASNGSRDELPSINPGPSTRAQIDTRTWSWGSVNFIPHAKFLPAKTMSLLLYIVQLDSALVSVGLSIARLAKQDYRTYEEDDRNRNSALNLFYGLVLAEASVFLLERLYWEYQLRWRNLLQLVSNQCGLSEGDVETVKHFFYQVYSRCLEDSVFNGLDLDLIGYSLDKLLSSTQAEQLSSVKVLFALAERERPGASLARRRIGTTPGVMERLVDMATWRHDTEIRRFATVVLSNVVQHDNNCFRITAIAGALEGITTMLLEHNDTKLHGLNILKQMAKDHRNCIRIGNTTGLVPIVIEMIEVTDQRLEKGSPEWKIRKKSLQLLELMATTGGESGQPLRKRIALMALGIRNLKTILQLRGAPDWDLQILAVDVLKNLANDDNIRELIGATGGVIQCLLNIFMEEVKDQRSRKFQLSFKAGEALNLLVLQNSKNCSRILCHKHYKKRIGVSQVLKDLIGILQRKSKTRIHAARILRGVCKSLNEEEVAEMKAVVPLVTKMVMELKDREQEAAIALLSAVVSLLDEKSFEEAFGSEEHKNLLAAKVIELVALPPPPLELIRIRRYTVELVSALMSKDAFFVQAFKSNGFVEQCLEEMLDTVADVENFYTFSGLMGITRHSRSIEEIITDALHKL